MSLPDCQTSSQEDNRTEQPRLASFKLYQEMKSMFLGVASDAEIKGRMPLNGFLGLSAQQLICNIFLWPLASILLSKAEDCCKFHYINHVTT